MKKQHDQDEVQQLKAQTFFHGGAPGLEVGAILDRKHWQAPTESVGAQILGMHPETPAVFITPDADFAEFFAAAAGHGDLYRVAPIGKITVDEDFDEGLSYACASAEVVEVLARGVERTEKNQMAGHQVMRWTDGAKVYGPDGYMLPSPQMRAVGVDEEYLRGYGWLVPVPVVTEDLMMKVMRGELSQPQI